MSNKEKRYKYARRIIKSTQIGRTLKKVREQYINENEPEYMVIPYVLTCAAYLESKLNDSFHDAEKQFGEEFSTAMMGLSLPNKLKTLVPVLTGGKFDINKEHFVYQRLISLIRTRNSIAHAKSEMEEVIASEDDLVDIPVFNSGMTKIPKQFMERTPDITIGAKKTFTPLEYHEAIDKLEKWFFNRCPDRLAKVAMVMDRSKEPQWEEQTSTFVKHLD